MRTLLRSTLPALLILFPGCDADQQVYGPAQVVVTPPPRQPGDPVATFEPDPAVQGRAVRLHGHGISADTIDIGLSTSWKSHPLITSDHTASVDLLLRIDPGSQAELLNFGQGSLCDGAPFEVTPTGNAGEWSLKRSATADVCACGDTNPWSYGAYSLGYVSLKIPTAGDWQVQLLPASSSPVCECVSGCLSSLAFRGGTVKVRAQ